MDDYYNSDYRRNGRARKRKRLKIPIHKTIGIVMVLIAFLFIVLVWGRNEDTSGALLVGGLGLFLLFGKFEEVEKKW